MNRKNAYLWLLVASNLFFGFIGLVIAGLNVIAEQQEKPLNQAKSEFIARFPKTEANNSAWKLRELSAKLGIYSLMGTKESTQRFPTSEKDKNAYDKIQNALSYYLQAQLEKPNNQIDVPSEKLRRYLTSNAANLAAIRTHVINSEIPHWEIDIENNLQPTKPLPSFLSLINFHKIFLLDALEKSRLGKNKEALDMLEVSWKLNQSVRERPEFIAQLIAIMIDRQQVGVLRKIPGLPTHWQERLRHIITQGYRQSFWISLEAEVWMNSEGIKRYGLFFPSLDGTDSQLVWSKVLKPLTQPYDRFSAIDYAQKTRTAIAKLSKQDFCSLDPNSTNQQLQTSFAGWNYLAPIAASSLLNQRRKVDKLVIDIELTQKILQVKEIASKTGSVPKQISGIESSTCGNSKWSYKISPDGTMSISLLNQPSWLKEKYRSNNSLKLPLTYSAKLKKSP